MAAKEKQKEIDANADYVSLEEQQELDKLSEIHGFSTSLGNINCARLVLPQLPPGHFLKDFIENHPIKDAPTEYKLAQALVLLSVVSYDRFYFQHGEKGYSGQLPNLRADISPVLIGPSSSMKSPIINEIKASFRSYQDVTLLQVSAEDIEAGETPPSKDWQDTQNISLDVSLIKDLGEDFTEASAREDIDECRKVYCIQNEIGPYMSYGQSKEGYRKAIPPFVTKLLTHDLGNAGRAGHKRLLSDGAIGWIVGGTTPSDLVKNLTISEITSGFFLRFLCFVLPTGYKVSTTGSGNPPLARPNTQKERTRDEITAELMRLYKNLSRSIENSPEKKKAMGPLGIRMLTDDESEQLYRVFETKIKKGMYSEEIKTTFDKDVVDSIDAKLLDLTRKLAMILTIGRRNILKEVDRVINYRIKHPEWYEAELRGDASKENVIFIDGLSMEIAIYLAETYFRENQIQIYLAVKELEGSGLGAIIQRIFISCGIEKEDHSYLLPEDSILRILENIQGNRYNHKAVESYLEHAQKKLHTIEFYNNGATGPILRLVPLKRVI